MTVGEFEKAKEQDLRERATQLFEQAGAAGELVRTALLTEARFYLDEIDRRDDKFRSRRDFWMEFAVISLIIIEISFSYVAFREGKEQFKVLNNLEISSIATASTLTALQQTMEQVNKAMQEQVALSYEVALKVQIDLGTSRLEITNEGHTPVTLWGAKIADQATLMQPRPSVLAPGAPHSIPAERVIAVAQQQMMNKEIAAVPVILFLKNEKGEQFVARYVLGGGSLNTIFSIHTQVISVTPSVWSKKSK